MAWFKRDNPPQAKGPAHRVKVPEGLWTKCVSCGETIYTKDIENNLNVCPKCNHHYRVSSKKRLELLLDEGSFTEFDAGVVSVDFLEFKDSKSYQDRIDQALAKGGSKDAIICGSGRIEGTPVQICVFDFSFMGGSMGSVVGEKITRGIERALSDRTPCIIVSASGGARMQESILSLMQMAKTSAALAKLREAGLPFVSILTDPTTGGVTASFAMLGDINMAEPKALIGFAGPRVIEQTIRQKLPQGFQRSEYLLDHGMVDVIVERSKMKSQLSSILTMLYRP
ncbi:acetyl-CoA carboxylase, carboxyl transferase, beta subunit [Citrifermentans bemidjiense Bem]|uniref:Acetyl-coenzyme A carboxylase carboxyl transferase subunit beta n=1 Tax=Citrifermentans bemidjiense (strain ATCC BAA-1014 / DSM 16622 / JCM 12645 / Bem) TaxID=404380 RepID=ACCD_CITBB|nr:acetyl-CoA carboxylase, carboxyltransferase subunit beta [Citrifermentans bemidjiense]B5EAK5.1 RecName: Full=Acetyl-coenzyme A carboxylase carboxyl transferase subunit beta; Short=ACCase subunit beta; Short=Acetyl-CoA carboxylase carboxyltransferase subunit beta [Citrifermentans bemidjiense Bem]ACH40344.1 acetyl-CoA carboxylase, carboxyl transferase, beta subunit [Citrifermentans bemidjiense Bem]